MSDINKNKNKTRIDLSQEKISLGKLMCFLSIALFLGGIGLDYFSAPELIGEIIYIRLAMCSLLALIMGMIIITPELFLKTYSSVISLLFISASVSILAMIYITEDAPIAHSTYFSGLMLIIVTVFLGTYISTFLSIFLSITIITGFIALSIFIDMPFNIAANNTFFLGSSLIVGIISNAMKSSQLLQILLLQSQLKDNLREQNIDLKKQSHLASIDSITDIPNRRYGYELLTKMIDTAKSLDMVVVIYFLDLNGFKKINDTYGHASGDKVLKIVSNRILNAGRKSDVFLRQGGDEFIYAIMIEKDNLAFGQNFKEALKNTVTPIMNVDGLRLAVNTSVGTAMYPYDGNCVNTLIKYADDQMYIDKSEYKNQLDSSIPDHNSFALNNNDTTNNQVVLPIKKYIKK